MKYKQIFIQLYNQTKTLFTALKSENVFRIDFPVMKRTDGT